VWQRTVAIAKTIAKGLEWLSDHLGWISGGLSIIMMVSIMREVIGRYFFHSPTEWVMELSTGLLIWATYLGAASTELRGGHVRIDFFYMHFRGRFKSAVNVFIYLIGTIWCSIVVWQGGIIAWESLIKGSRSSSPIMWPLFPWQMMVPIGSFLFCLILIVRLVRNIDDLFQKGQ